MHITGYKVEFIVNIGFPYTADFICTSVAYYLHHIQSRKYSSRTTTNIQKKRKSDDKELAETERPEIKMTKASTKRERLEDKMIEYIDLTKKSRGGPKKR